AAAACAAPTRPSYGRSPALPEPAASARPGCAEPVSTEARYNSTCRPGDRGPGNRLEESPDTTGQDAGEIPGGESRRKVAQKGDRHRRNFISGDAGGKGERVG